MFDSHHGVIAQALLDQVAFLDQRIAQMEAGAIEALAQVQESWGVDATGDTGPRAGTSPDSPVLAAAYRLAEIPGISLWLAIVIIAEIGLNMAAFPTPAHLISWIGLCRSAAQSGTRHGKGKQKKGNSYARAAAGQAALGAAGSAQVAMSSAAADRTSPHRDTTTPQRSHVSRHSLKGWAPALLAATRHGGGEMPRKPSVHARAEWLTQLAW